MTMEVRIDSLFAGAERASGHVVIIDVFRSFTTAAVALSRGAEKIIMVERIEDALALRQSDIGQLCMGEVGWRMPLDFDLGNSPFQATQMAVAGKTIIQRTSAGMQGIVAAAGAERLYASSLVTLKATSQALVKAKTGLVSLVSMGEMVKNERMRMNSAPFTCATCLRDGQETAVPCGKLFSPVARIADFNNPAKTHLHPEDLTIALDVDRIRLCGAHQTGKRSRQSRGLERGEH
jgi:2-phosphosulfolactate phosphatase